jgi:two-component system, NarL family, sensor kinase
MFEEVNSLNKIEVSFITFGEAVKLTDEIELNIFRILTELINNCIKHSDTKKVEVQLIYHKNYLFVSFEENGDFVKKEKNNLGIGLKNVISRMEYIKAKIIAKPSEKSYNYMFEVQY